VKIKSSARRSHIGYVHLDELKLYDTYGTGILERVPASLPLVGSLHSHREDR